MDRSSQAAETAIETHGVSNGGNSMKDSFRLRNPACDPATEPLAASARSWQRHPAVQLAGAAAAVLPMAAISAWIYVIRQGPMTLSHLLLGPLVGGGAMILWILLLQFSVAGDRAEGLGLRTDRRGRSWSSWYG